MRFLNDVHETGTTLIVATHDTDLAYEWADLAWVLIEGRVAAQGPIREVLHDRRTLEQARLKLPFVLELAMTIQEVSPELADQPLPKNREQLIRIIQQLRGIPISKRT